MQTDKTTQLFAEIANEESSTVSGGVTGPFIRRAFVASGGTPTLARRADRIFANLQLSLLRLYGPAGINNFWSSFARRLVTGR